MNIAALFANPVYAAILTRFEAQQLKGLEKYGTFINTDDYDLLGWIEHAQQEMMDQMVYLEAIKQKLQEQSKLGRTSP